MGRLVVNMFMTIDQVMQGPGGLDEDTEGGFEHGGWQAQFGDAESGRLIFDQNLGMDALLIGRKTYDIWADYWPKHVDNPIGEHFDRIPRYVASSTLGEPSWTGTHVIRDVPTEVAALKTQYDELMLVGSAGLLQTLLTYDLVDQFNFWVYPLVLGSGKRVFRDGGMPAGFALAQPPQGFPNGAVLLTYTRGGDLTFGNIADDL